MQGIINIHGFIGSFPGPDGKEIKGIELIDVIAQHQAQPLATSLLVDINSKGGSCSVGHDIYLYLKTCGLPVDTQATGDCCSMASIIMMAGENRTGIEPLDFLPHNPWTDGLKGDADEIAQKAEELRIIEDKMIGVYADATGISKEGVNSIMKLDKSIPLKKAVELKFLTAIKGQGTDDKTQRDMAETTLIQKLDKKFNALMRALKVTEPKAMTATTTDGKAIEFLSSTGEDYVGDPLPGDLVMIAGAPAPDGSYAFANYTVDVLMGVVTTVTPTASAIEAKKKADELAAAAAAKNELTKDADKILKDENEVLKKENEELRKFAEDLGAKIEGLEKAVGVIKSTYQAPEGQTGFVARGVKGEVSDLKKLAEEARKKYKK